MQASRYCYGFCKRYPCLSLCLHKWHSPGRNKIASLCSKRDISELLLRGGAQLPLCKHINYRCIYVGRLRKYIVFQTQRPDLIITQEYNTCIYHKYTSGHYTQEIIGPLYFATCTANLAHTTIQCAVRTWTLNFHIVPTGTPGMGPKWLEGTMVHTLVRPTHAMPWERIEKAGSVVQW